MSRAHSLIGITLVLALFGVACSGAPTRSDISRTSDGPTTSTISTADVNTPRSTTPGAVATVPAATTAASSDTSRWDRVAALLVESSTEQALITWGRQALPGASEVEFYQSIDSMTQASSAVVVARIVGPGPTREVRGDEGTEDVLVYESTEIEVIEALGGTRPVNAGDSLWVEGFVGPTADAVGTVALYFLRRKGDNLQGERRPNALPGESDRWRLISSQGVIIDRGDGVPISPIREVLQLVELGAEIPLDEFIFREERPDPNLYPIAAELRDLTMLALLDLVTDQ